MRRIVFIPLILICCISFAQTNVSLRYFGFTIHPFGDQTAELQPYKLDKHARFVANFGGFLSIDHYFFYDQFAVSVMQGLFTDCSAGLAGFSHVGVKAKILDAGKHRLMIDVGPLLYYRQDWSRFPEYDDKGVFHHYNTSAFGPIQYRIFPLGLECCYNYQISDQFDLNAGFTPGLPFALTFSAGVTWWPQRFSVKYDQPRIYFHRKNRTTE